MYVHHVSVAKMMRGMGLGREFFRFVEARARFFGCAEIQLECVSGHKKSNAYYSYNGYVLEEGFISVQNQCTSN